MKRCPRKAPKQRVTVVLTVTATVTSRSSDFSSCPTFPFQVTLVPFLWFTPAKSSKYTNTMQSHHVPICTVDIMICLIYRIQGPAVGAMPFNKVRCSNLTSSHGSLWGRCTNEMPITMLHMYTASGVLRINSSKLQRAYTAICHCICKRCHALIHREQNVAMTGLEVVSIGLPVR